MEVELPPFLRLDIVGGRADLAGQNGSGAGVKSGQGLFSSPSREGLTALPTVTF